MVARRSATILEAAADCDAEREPAEPKRRCPLDRESASWAAESVMLGRQVTFKTEAP